MAFPPGITVEGATPRGGVTVNREGKRLTLPGAALRLIVEERGNPCHSYPMWVSRHSLDCDGESFAR